MTDDIVARLREEGFVTHMARLPRESKILHDAADEIERLRAERDALLKQRANWIAGAQLHAARANDNPPEIRSHRDSADA